MDSNTFEGISQDLGWGTVFGGHVLGQALSAAQFTCHETLTAHSLHAYFLLPGRVNAPIRYVVKNCRDGRSFSTRAVEALQGNQQIFTCMISFQKQEEGLTHQSPMPEVPSPQTLVNEHTLAARIEDSLPKNLRSASRRPRAIEIRPVDPVNPMSPSKKPPRRQVWQRACTDRSLSANMQQCLLAYASDFSFITTALQPHGVSWLTPTIRMASLDHSIWFHRPVNVKDWFLHSMESTNTHGGRGFVRGQVFDLNGQLIASTAQEGVIRVKATD